MKNNRGFSLIETIISIAIIAFAMASAIVIFRSQLVGNLASDSQIMADRLQDARSRAVAGVNGTAWGIHFDNNTTTPYYALFTGSSYTAATATYYLSGLVQFTVPAQGTTTDVVFTRLTGNTAGTTTIVLRLAGDASSTKNIVVSPQGSIVIQ